MCTYCYFLICDCGTSPKQAAESGFALPVKMLSSSPGKGRLVKGLYRGFAKVHSGLLAFMNFSGLLSH